MRSIAAVVTAIALAGCAELSTTKEGDDQSIDASIETFSGGRFAVEVTAINLDGYEVARCLAAGYANGLRDDDDTLQFAVFTRTGGKITDEFRRKDGIRTQTSKGVQTYALTSEVSPEDHDGRDTVAVATQLAACEQAGLPTTIQ